LRLPKRSTSPCMGLSKSSTYFTAFSTSFIPVPLFDLEIPVCIAKPARAGAVKVGRRSNPAARTDLAWPHLYSFEHDGPLDAVGMTIRGEPAFRARLSRHNLVFGGSKDPNHDAVMRIGSEAPRRRTHST
jgi:hypothetical protein